MGKSIKTQNSQRAIKNNENESFPEEEINKENISSGNSNLRIESLSISGPLPPPQILEEYNLAYPKAAELIIGMAEKEQSNRIARENKFFDFEYKLQSRGQLFAFIIAMVGLIVSGFLLYEDKTIGGSIFGGTTLLGIISLFIKHLKSEKNK